MDALTIFESKEFGRIRTILQDGEPWFVAANVCKALDIQNATDAIKKLDHDERTMLNVGCQGETNSISEDLIGRAS